MSELQEESVLCPENVRGLDIVHLPGKQVTMNLYLSFDHTNIEGENTFYYFRSGLFHGTGFTDLLLLAADIDLVELFTLPARIPSFLPAETVVQNLDGNPYEIPEDLYLLYISSMAISPISSPLIDIITDGLSSQSICVYGEVPPSESPEYPSGFSPEDKEPNVEGKPGWYVGALSLQSLTIASRKSSSPFWTIGCIDFFDAYAGGDYNCEGLPYNIHITCNPGLLTVWLPPSNYNDHGYWKEEDYYRDIDSDATSWRGFPITYDPGTVRSIEGQQYRPSSYADPILYFPSEVPAQPQIGPGPFPFFIHSLALILPQLLQKLFPVASFRLASTCLSAPRSYVVIVNTNDHMTVNSDDHVQVDF